MSPDEHYMMAENLLKRSEDILESISAVKKDPMITVDKGFISEWLEIAKIHAQLALVPERYADR